MKIENESKLVFDYRFPNIFDKLFLSEDLMKFHLLFGNRFEKHISLLKVYKN